MQNGINNKHKRANFIFDLSPCGEFLIIVDLDIFGNGISVAMDVRNVLKSIEDKGYPLYKLKVIYQDTQAVFDAILINKDNSFHSLTSLNVMGKEKAMLAYNEKIKNQKLR